MFAESASISKMKVFLVLCALQLFWQSSNGADTYTAVVVEYHPVPLAKVAPEVILNRNVDAYVRILADVQSQMPDIIVYPESTITFGAGGLTRNSSLEISTLVPDPKDGIVPCEKPDGVYLPFFKYLSCAAADHKTYIVVNLHEKAVCREEVQKASEDERPCANDNWDMYNTNVVFDRQGKVVSRYRKYHLFGEYPLNTTATAEVVTFTTDFNVTFGMFTCFDVLFEEPALSLVRQGVKHIIFPSMWFSELPFLTALQAQNMFAVENDVVMLAAGANRPIVGSGGTGIYVGKLGPLRAEIIAEGGSKAFVQTVPKSWQGSESNVSSLFNRTTDEMAEDMDSFKLDQDFIIKYESLPINGSRELYSETLCHESLCCKFDVKLSVRSVKNEEKAYQYRMFAYSGIRSFSGVTNAGVDICAIASCHNSSIESCGKRFSSYDGVTWPITFDEITIKANMTRSNQTIQYPNTLLSSIRPLPSQDYAWTNRQLGSENVERTIELLKPQDRLMTFGIFGRDFTKDGLPNSGANGFAINVICLIAVLYLLIPQQ